MPAPEILLIVLGLSAALSFFLAGYAYARRRIKGAVECSGMLSASALYTLGYGFEIAQSSLDGMLWALRIEYVGVGFICYFWLLFALSFTGTAEPGRAVRRWLAVPSCLVVLLFWTDPWHHWFYARAWVRTDSPFPLIATEPGIAYWVHIAISQIEILVGAVLLIRYALIAEHRRRRQAQAVAVASLFPWVAFGAYIFGATPWHLDATPLGTIGSGVVVAWALLRLGALDLVPAARELAIDSLRDGFVVLDRRGTVADANEAARALLGEPLRQGDRLVASSGQPTGHDAIARLVSAGEGREDFRVSARDGAERCLSVQCLPVQDERDRGAGHVLVIRDVTESTVLLERLTAMALTDELTGLCNRRQFLDLGIREIERARRASRWVAVALLDLDYFKTINDRYGHDAGDEVLRGVAVRLRSAVRLSDVLCRYGGEEFAVVMPEIDAASADHAAERFRAAVAKEPCVWNGTAIPVTASIGTCALVPGSQDTLDLLMSRADQALYLAKASGRNRCESWRAGSGLQ